MLTDSDRIAINEVISLYGHLLDERMWSRLDEVFVQDAVYEASGGEQEPTRSLDEMRTLWSTNLRLHPLAHHATNVVVTEDADGTVRVLSKGLGVGYKGRVGSIVYRDVMRRTEAGWRIAHRIVTIRTPETIPDPS